MPHTQPKNPWTFGLCSQASPGVCESSHPGNPGVARWSPVVSAGAGWRPEFVNLGVDLFQFFKDFRPPLEQFGQPFCLILVWYCPLQR